MIFNQKVLKSDELLVDYISQGKDNELKFWIICKLSEISFISIRNFKLDKSTHDFVLQKIDNLIKFSTLFMKYPKKRFVLWIKGFQSNSEVIPNLIQF